ncbi:MAG: carbonic anhydrase [Planctomycetes bacterium]|nr:carbonic anhydrase [Planctomycetota bacterium]
MPIPELEAGWRRFRSGRYREQRRLFDQMAREGQRPHTLMVACCDSRVDPAILFDCDPGELFVVRNVANLVPPCEVDDGGPHTSFHGTSAAIEFGISVLAVDHIVVLGHSQCGGIRALIEGIPAAFGPMPFLSSWIALADEARERAFAADPEPARLATICEQLAIGLSLRNLRTFPAVRDRIAAGRLSLHGLHYDLRDGALSLLDVDLGRFVAVDGGDADA